MRDVESGAERLSGLPVFPAPNHHVHRRSVCIACSPLSPRHRNSLIGKVVFDINIVDLAS